MHEKRLVGMGLLLGMVLMPTAAMACVVCFQAQLWYIYPPIIEWAWIGFFWFLSLVILQNFSGNLVPNFPKSILSPFLWLLLACLLGGMMMGFLPFVFLLLFPLQATLSTYRDASPDLGKTSKAAVYLVGVLFISIFLWTILSETVNPTPRDPVSTILQTPGSGLQSTTITKLAIEKPFPLESFRQIVREGDSSTVWVVSKHLLENGNLSIEVPLCIEALERFEQNHGDRGNRQSFESILLGYTNLGLPENSSAETWRKAWEAQKRTNL